MERRQQIGGSEDVALQQDPVTLALLIVTSPAAPISADVIDRAARLLGIIYGDVGQLAQRAVTGDALVQLRVAGAEIDPRDVSDRAARLLGITYGNQAQLQQVPGTLELITQDTGVNTNPEQWFHDNHWETEEVTITVPGGAGEQPLGAAVPVGMVRRARELTVRHAGTNPTVVTLLIAGGATKVSFDVPALSSRPWSSQNGRRFIAGQVSAVQSSDVAGGNTYVSASGVEK